MSVEPETRELSGSSPPQSLDLTGLPAPVANDLQRLVATLRNNLGHASSPSAPFKQEPAEAWARRLQSWVDSHPARPITIDDSRESVYSGRGE
jgi:hypothetical protein